MCCQTSVEDSLQDFPRNFQERDWTVTADLVYRKFRFGDEDYGRGFEKSRKMTTGQRGIENSAESVYHVRW